MRNKAFYAGMTVFLIGIFFSTSSLAKRQVGGARYWFDEAGNYNGLDISYCNFPQDRYERIPGVQPGPYYREDSLVCSPLLSIQTGFECFMDTPPATLPPIPPEERSWSCTPVSLGSYTADGTSSYLPAWMTLEDSCNIVNCGMQGIQPYYQHVPGANHL